MFRYGPEEMLAIDVKGFMADKEIATIGRVIQNRERRMNLF
jgi:hypothetical protein